MEATILLALQSLRLPVLTQLAALVSAFGNYAFIWVVIGILLIVFAHRNDVGVTVIFTVILAGIIVGFMLQPMFAHVRPYDARHRRERSDGREQDGVFVPELPCGNVICRRDGHRHDRWASVGELGIRRSRPHIVVPCVSGCGVAHRHRRRGRCRRSRRRCLGMGIQSVPARPHPRLPRRQSRA